MEPQQNIQSPISPLPPVEKHSYKYVLCAIFTLTFIFGVAFLFLDNNTDKVKLVESESTKNVVWKTYLDPAWGVSISYPEKYYLQSSHKTVYKDIPAQGTILSITDTQSTSTANSFVDVSAVVMTQFTEPKNVLDPSVTLISTSSSKRITYYSKPPILFAITTSPANDADLDKILNSFSVSSGVEATKTFDFYTNVVLQKNNNPVWCLKLSRKEEIDACKGSQKSVATTASSFPINFASIKSDSGGTGGSVKGTTLTIDSKKGSNVWLAGAVENKTDMNYIEFDANIVNGQNAEALLSVYLNDTQVGMVDGRIDNGKTHQIFRLYLKDLIGPNPYAPNYVAPGLYTLSFRLDSFKDGKTSVSLSNIKVGLKK